MLSFAACATGLGWSLWNAGMPPVASLSLPKIGYEPWTTLDYEELEDGATVPAHMNVLFRLPIDMPQVRRETLLGNRGEDVRYWGYCFYNKDDPEDSRQSNGFPGRMFLSEAERNVRERQVMQQTGRYSIFDPPTQAELERDDALLRYHSNIRHQIEIFHGGQSCYIQTSSPLPIGVDRDDDGLNTALEKQYGTDPTTSDTDQDNASDSVEALWLHTNPLDPDSDGDNLLDGIEVHGHSHITAEDTNPLDPDSDKDTLCDGYCIVDKNRRFCPVDDPSNCVETANRWAGEDKNLNGAVDEGESNPLLKDSNSDGILDEQDFYNCLLNGGTDC
jgi:hypothetical protein